MSQISTEYEKLVLAKLDFLISELECIKRDIKIIHQKMECIEKNISPKKEQYIVHLPTFKKEELDFNLDDD